MNNNHPRKPFLPTWKISPIFYPMGALRACNDARKRSSAEVRMQKIGQASASLKTMKQLCHSQAPLPSLPQPQEETQPPLKADAISREEGVLLIDVSNFEARAGLDTLSKARLLANKSLASLVAQHESQYATSHYSVSRPTFTHYSLAKSCRSALSFELRDTASLPSLFTALVIDAMTPIKVRGKRKPTNPKHSVDSLLNPCSNGKRPLSPVLGDYLPPVKSARQTTSTSAPGPRARAIRKFESPLEQLPTELLEHIFFRSLNVSLPQASLLIGHKLASSHVKTQLTLRVCSAGSSTEYPSDLATIIPTVRQQAEIQSAILRLRWMTLPFLRTLIPDYIVKTLVRQLAVRKLQWLGTGPVVSRETEPVIRRYLEENMYRLDQVEPQGLPAYWEIQWPTRNNDVFMCVGIGLRDGLVTIREPRSPSHPWQSWVEHDAHPSRQFSRWRILCGVQGCRIPEKLLHGSWNDDKCEFLELAIRGNASVDWIETTSGEIAKQGLLDALHQRNARAIRALMARVGEREILDCCPTRYYIDEEARALDKPESSKYIDFPIRRGVGIVPETEHMRMAVEEEGCQQDVVEALLSAGDSKIEVDSRDIYRWAFLENNFCDERGELLLRKISTLGT